MFFPVFQVLINSLFLDIFKIYKDTLKIYWDTLEMYPVMWPYSNRELHLGMSSCENILQYQKKESYLFFATCKTYMKTLLHLPSSLFLLNQLLLTWSYPFAVNCFQLVLDFSHLTHIIHLTPSTGSFPSFSLFIKKSSQFVFLIFCLTFLLSFPSKLL